MHGQRFAHSICRSVLLFGFACFILYLTRSGNILYYIAPRMIDFVKLAAIGLYAVAVYEAYRAAKQLFETASEPECDCEAPQQFRLRSVLLYAFFAFPLLLGFAMPDSMMGSTLAAKKGVNLSSSQTVPGSHVSRSQSEPAPSALSKSGAALTAEELRTLFPFDPSTEPYARLAMQLYKKGAVHVKEELFMETITAVDLYLDRFVGVEMELSGFVYREEGMKDNQFIIARFALQCCSADASPYGIVADYEQARVLPNDTWVKATGTIRKTRYNDLDVLSIKIDKADKINAPKSAYVYPNASFGR